MNTTEQQDNDPKIITELDTDNDSNIKISLRSIIEKKLELPTPRSNLHEECEDENNIDLSDNIDLSTPEYYFIVKPLKIEKKVEISTSGNSDLRGDFVDEIKIDLNANFFNLTVSIITENIIHVYMLRFSRYMKKQYDAERERYLRNISITGGGIDEDMRIIVGKKRVSELLIMEQERIIKNNEILQVIPIREKTLDKAFVIATPHINKTMRAIEDDEAPSVEDLINSLRMMQNIIIDEKFILTMATNIIQMNKLKYLSQ